jgi:hypothetical protein
MPLGLQPSFILNCHNVVCLSSIILDECRYFFLTTTIIIQLAIFINKT